MADLRPREAYGQIFFVDNTIESISEDIDIQVGLTDSTADLKLNRNTVLASGKSLTFPDNTSQTTAYIAPAETPYPVQGGTSGTQPTFTGDPLFTASYIKMSNNLVNFQIQVDMDNITSFGTGQYYLKLPFTSKYEITFRDGCLHDGPAGGKSYHISGQVAAGSDTMTLWSTDRVGSAIEDVPFTATSAFTLSTADNFHISGTYIAE